MKTALRLLPILTLLSLTLALHAQRQDRAKLSINNSRMNTLNREAVKVKGNTYVPVRPFFRQIGGNVDARKSGVYVNRDGRKLQFRPGSRVWYYDDQPRYFPGAPFVRGGQLYVPGRSIIEALGGRCRYDDYGCENYWLGDRDTWLGPGDLRLTRPRSGARFDGSSFILEGYATPLRDVRVLLYRQGGGNWRDQLVYDTMLRAERSGHFDARLPLFGDGLYRVVVQLLNDYGGIVDEKSTIIRRD